MASTSTPSSSLSSTTAKRGLDSAVTSDDDACDNSVDYFNCSHKEDENTIHFSDEDEEEQFRAVCKRSLSTTMASTSTPSSSLSSTTAKRGLDSAVTSDDDACDNSVDYFNCSHKEDENTIHFSDEDEEEQFRAVCKRSLSTTMASTSTPSSSLSSTTAKRGLDSAVTSDDDACDNSVDYFNCSHKEDENTIHFSDEDEEEQFRAVCKRSLSTTMASTSTPSSSLSSTTAKRGLDSAVTSDDDACDNSVDYFNCSHKEDENTIHFSDEDEEEQFRAVCKRSLSTTMASTSTPSSSLSSTTAKRGLDSAVTSDDDACDNSVDYFNCSHKEDENTIHFSDEDEEEQFRAVCKRVFTLDDDGIHIYALFILVIYYCKTRTRFGSHERR
ncbi:hypothetical protein GE061_016758 [Apolygus lucorum]|uniref:Uncharacterized protein n=1 Tax=Apolygus lucorum TaxID=248454 RepID=A0A8S9XIC8_APOLU|nr:hypothetical protein GE061_016758 [Apolygus lucorum]